MAVHIQGVNPTLTNAATNKANNATNNTNTSNGYQPSALHFHSGALFGAPIPRGIGSEYYSKFKENLLHIFKSANGGVDIQIKDLDKTTEIGLAYSAMIITLQHTHNPGLGVAYHTLVLEATGDKLAPVLSTVDNVQFEVTRTCGYALDEVLYKKAEAIVVKAYPNVPVYMVDGCVIPHNFNPEDMYQMQQLALNAGLACGTELAIREADFRDVNLAVAKTDVNLNIDVSFNKQQINDACGLPMRSDCMITFSSKNVSKGQTFGSVNSGSNELKLSELSAFVDLVYSPPENSIANQFMQQQVLNVPKYSARMIITDVKSNYSYTAGSTLLAIATAFSLRDNWVQAFKPVGFNDKEIDLGDIGSLNIEANLYNEPNGYGTYIDTKTSDFRLEDLGQLVGAMVQPGLIISLDCPEVGPQSWYLSVFSSAASGVTSAIQAIYQAADTLTNGAFRNHFKIDQPMFVDTNNRIHNGYWKDRTGTVRDIRDIDYLAVCNLAGDRNPAIIRDWSDTIFRTNYDLNLRLSARKKMISSLTGETAVFTGFTQRVTFSAAFLNALAQSIIEVGLAIKVSTPLSGADIQNRRGIADFTKTAVMNPGASWVPASNGTAGHGNSGSQFNQFRW